jgi:cyclopropane-fatty-acyl-phospholipid synthase
MKISVMHLRPRQIVTDCFSDCDVQINGDAPSDIHIKNPEFFGRTLIHGSLGLGESYMDG